MVYPSDILLTVINTGYICSRADIVVEDCDAVWESFVIKWNISDVLQSVFAGGAFGPTNCRRFNVVLVQGDGSLYRFAQTLLHVHENKHGPDLEEKKNAFVQYVDVTSSVDDIKKELNYAGLQWVTTYSLDHSIDFSIVNYKMIEASKWYVLVSFSSILCVHHVMLFCASFLSTATMVHTRPLCKLLFSV